MTELNGQSTQAGVPGVKGENTGGGDGVFGTGRRGVVGESETFQGVLGKSRDNAGVVGESQKFHAVFAISHSSNNGGVIGINDAGGFGVIGRGRVGVTGESETFQGVLGTSRDNAGIVGESAKFHAVFGISHDVNNAGVFGTNDQGGFGVIGVSEKGIGISGKGGKLAGRFEGKVNITESLTVQGVDVVGLLRHLQQLEPLFQRLLRLEPILAELEAEFAARSIISLQQVARVNDEVARFIITGKNFRPGATIKIKVKSNSSAGQLLFLQTDGQGTLGLNTSLELTCRRGTILSIGALDENTSQVSSTVTIVCT